MFCIHLMHNSLYTWSLYWLDACTCLGGYRVCLAQCGIFHSAPDMLSPYYMNSPYSASFHTTSMSAVLKPILTHAALRISGNLGMFPTPIKQTACNHSIRTIGKKNLDLTPRGGRCALPHCKVVGSVEAAHGGNSYPSHQYWCGAARVTD